MTDKKITESDRERAAKICQDLDAFIERCRVEGIWPPKGREGEEYLKLCLEQAFAEIRAEAQTRAVLPSEEEIEDWIDNNVGIWDHEIPVDEVVSDVAHRVSNWLVSRLKAKPRKPLPESVASAIKELPYCGDGSCYFSAGRKGGQHTNGGCRCLSTRSQMQAPPIERFALRAARAFKDLEAWERGE